MRNFVNMSQSSNFLLELVTKCIVTFKLLICAWHKFLLKKRPGNLERKFSNRREDKRNKEIIGCHKV